MSAMMMISESKMAMTLSKKAMHHMESMALDMARQAITECAEVYGFSAEEAILRLGASQVSLRTESKPAAKKTKIEKTAKATFPLPFSGVVRTDCCQGVKPNRGLYSQCDKECVQDGEFCNGCAKQAAKNASGEPDCGIITKRDCTDWRDPKGKAPIAFIKVMKKLKLSEEDVLAEVARLNVAFDTSIHFAKEAEKESKRGRPKKAITSDTESEVQSEKKRGRPKKAAKVVEISPTEDLFATLVEDAKAAGEMKGEMSDLSGSDSDSESGSKKSKKSPAEKAAKKAEKEAAKAEKEAQKAAEKAEKEAEAVAKKAEKEAEAVAKKAEKEAEAVAKKAEKEAQKATEKAAKDAEALAKKAAKEAEALAKKAEKEAQKASKPKAKVSKKTEEVKAPAVEVPELVAEEESDDDEPAVAVAKFEFKGKMYLKSSNGVIYDRETQDEIGVWNEAKQDIDFL